VPGLQFKVQGARQKGKLHFMRVFQCQEDLASIGDRACAHKFDISNADVLESIEGIHLLNLIDSLGAEKG